MRPGIKRICDIFVINKNKKYFSSLLLVANNNNVDRLSINCILYGTCETKSKRTCPDEMLLSIQNCVVVLSCFTLKISMVLLILLQDNHA